jgi:hypothetical protein
MISLLLAAAVYAQSSVSIRVGDKSPDTLTAAAKKDSIEEAREARRDSLRERMARSDSSGRVRRAARQIRLTPALAASAFRDQRARTLLEAARVARLQQDSSLRGYDATAYERMSVGLGIRRIGRDRLLFRTESVTRIIWTRGSAALVQVLARRRVMPMLEGAGDADLEMDNVPIPYYPGRETLWVGSGLAKADISEGEIIHPLARGAEAYYTYATGDSVTFQLPAGQRINLRELIVRPRAPRWNVALGSLWFDISSAQLVRAVYRLAEPLDIWAIANEESERPDDKPPKWLTAMTSPMTGQLNAVTVEYGLHEGRFWLPRLQGLEGSARAGFLRVPFKMEQTFKYASVNGNGGIALPQIAVSDTARDSVSRAARRLARRSECKSPGAVRTTTQRRREGMPMLVIQEPCDTTLLAQSPELPKSIYDENEEVFGTKERDALISEALTLGAQPGFIPQRPVISYGLQYTRYNKIEGLSSGIGVRQSLGGGYTVRGFGRIGVADLSPNGEASVTRSDGRKSIALGAYRRLMSANDFSDPFAFGASLSSLLFGRDEGFYYRTWGAELTGTGDDSASGSFRLFAEHHSDASKETNFSIAQKIGGDGFSENIDATNGSVVGVAIERHGTRGLDPHGLRLFGNVRVEAAAGDFDYTRGMFDFTLSHGLGPRLDGALTLAAGTSGGAVTTQRLWYVGGTQTVRGQKPGAAIGNSFWMTRAELGSSFVGARPVVFADLGWAGDRRDWNTRIHPMSGAGIGASFMDGLVRFDLAKGIYPEKKIRASLYVESRF